VRNVKQNHLREAAPRRFYLAFFQHNDEIDALNLEIRTSGDSASLLASVRRGIASVDPKLPILSLKSADALIDATLDQERLIAKLSTLFGFLALLLAAIGLYGVLSYRTARRVSEIGIRMALGARRQTVVAMVLREMGVLVAAGILGGALLSLAVAAPLRNRLFGLSPVEVGPLLAAAAVIAIASMAAGIVPAWRASQVDPALALRSE